MDSQIVIAAELQDLSGLLSDLYARIAAAEPGLAGPVAELLAASARDFGAVAAADPSRH